MTEGEEQLTCCPRNTELHAPPKSSTELYSSQVKTKAIAKRVFFSISQHGWHIESTSVLGKWSCNSRQTRTMISDEEHNKIIVRTFSNIFLCTKPIKVLTAEEAQKLNVTDLGGGLRGNPYKISYFCFKPKLTWPNTISPRIDDVATKISSFIFNLFFYSRNPALTLPLENFHLCPQLNLNFALVSPFTQYLLFALKAPSHSHALAPSPTPLGTHSGELSPFLIGFLLCFWCFSLIPSCLL